MANSSDFPARGKIIAVNDDSVIFAPAGTNYELKLATHTRYAGPVNSLITGRVRATARKVYTVPSGGNFITPIQGPTKIVQGRVRFADNQSIVLFAGCPVLIDLPTEEHAVDLHHYGGIGPGAMVNAVLLPGAWFEFVEALVGAK